MENIEQDLLGSLDELNMDLLGQESEELEENNINILEEEKSSNTDLKSTSNDFFDDIDLSKIPEEFSLNETEVAKSDIIDNKEEIKLGLTPEDLKELYNYISGKGNKPLFIDKFTSDSEGRLRDELYIMNLLQLSKLPMLIAFQSQIQDLMYRPENLAKMEIKDLTKASRDISAEVQGIMKSAVDTVQTLNTLGALNNEYRQLLNAMTMLPEEKLARIKEIVFME